MHRKRRALAERLVRSDLSAERSEGCDLLGEFRRLSDLALVEVLVLERAVEAFDDAVGLGRVAGVRVF